MSRTKTVLSVVLILGLGSLAVYLNRDRFTRRPIQISYRVSPWLKQMRRGRSRGSLDLGTPVVFSLNTYYKLKSVKVVVAAEIETNKYAHSLWEMISESNSVPTASFAYGEHLRGMVTKVKNARPDPLEPGVTYRLLIETPDEEAQHDFTTTPSRPSPDQPAADK